jgi:TP901 family phage tail tape measure protein
MSDTNLGRAILEISTKDTDAKAGLNKFKSDAESTLKQIQTAFDRLGKTLSTSLDSSLGKLQSNLNKLEGSGKSAAAGLKSLESSSSAAEKAAGNLHKTAGNVGSALQNLGKGAADASGGILRLGSGAIGSVVGGLERVGNIAITAGAAITKLGLIGGTALVGLASLGAKSAGDLEQSINNISTIAPNINTAELFKSLNDMSTRVPQTAAQLGDSLYNIFSSIDVSQQDALKLLENFSKGAVGAGTDAETFGTAIMGVLNAYKLNVGDASKVSDIFFNTVNKGVISGQELATSLGPVTQSAKAAGVSIEELGAMIAGVTKEGGPAAQNVNNLNNLFQKVTTKDAQKAINDLGVKTLDTAGNFRPILDVFTDLKAKLGPLTEAQRANALQAIFPDAQARQGAQTILSQLDFVKDALKDNEAQTDSSRKAFEKMVSGFVAQTKILKNTFIADITALGSGLLPILTPAITGLTTSLKNSESSFEAFGKILGNVLGVGLKELSKVFVTVRDGVLTFKSALAGDWMDTEKIRPIHALIGNIGLVIKNDVLPAVKDFIDGFNKVAGVVGPLVSTFSPLSIALSVLRGFMVGGMDGAIDAFGKRIGDIGKVLGDLGKNITNWLKDNGENLVKNLGEWSKNLVEWVANAAGPLIVELGKLVVSLLNGIANNAPAILDQLASWGKSFIEWVGPQIPPLLGALGNLAGAVGQWIIDRAPDFINQLGVWGGAFIDWVGKDVLPQIPGALGTIASAIGTWVSAFAGSIGPKLGEWASKFWEWVKDVWPNLLKGLGDLVGNVLGWIGAQAGGILPAFENEWGPAFWKWVGEVSPNVGKALDDFFPTVTSWIAARGIDIHNGMVNDWGPKFVSGVGEALKGLDKAVGDAADWVRKLIGEMATTWWNNGMDAGKKLVDGIVGGLSAAWDTVKGWFSDAINGLISFVKGLFGIASPSTIFIDIGQNIIAGLIQGLTGAWSGVTAIWDGFISELKSKWDGFVDWFGGSPASRVHDFAVKYVQEAEGMSDGWGTQTERGKNFFANMVGSIEGSVNTFGIAIAKMVPAAESAVLGVIGKLSNSGVTSAALQLGVNIANSISSGILSMASSVASAASQVVANALKAARSSVGSISIPAPTIIGGGGGGGGGSAPAPVSPGNRSAQSLGGASALSLGGSLVRDLVGTGVSAISAVTQKAAQAGTSLTGLQSQINDILALFKSLDAKALKAASDQAEQVSKIVSAASGMADLFTKLKDYSGVSKQLMQQFSADSVEMTNQYVESSKQFDAKALKGAEQYIDTSGKVASAASSMADTLVKLRDWEGPINASIEGFAYNAKVLTANYYNASLEFNKDMLDATDRYSDTAGKVGDSASKTADALVKILDWKGVATVSIEGFVFNQKVLTANYYNASLEFNDKMLEGASKFAEASAKVADSTGKGADSLAKLKDWEGIATVSIEGFAFNMKVATANFYNASREFDEKMLKGAGDFADTSGKVAQAIGQGVTGLSGLNDYKGVTTATFETFTADLDAAVLAFSQFAVNYQSDSLKAAGVYAETAGKIVGVLKPGVEGFAGLADYKAVAADKLGVFEADLYKLMQDTTTEAATFKPTALEAGKAWGDAVGGISTGLGNSMKLFEGLQTYKSVPSATITLFIADIELTVKLAGEMAERAKGPLLDRLKDFTDATGGLFTELSNAMSLFKGLQEFKSTPSATIQAFIDEIEITVNKTDALAKKTDTDLLARAKSFSTAVGGIFTELNTAITTFKGLQDLKDDPGKTVDVLIGGVNTAINKMAGAQTAANNLYNEAVAFHKKMQDAANEMAAGLQAGANTGSPAATISNFNPIGAGAAGTNLFSTGQSMGNSLVGGIKDALQIHSPSQVLIGIGKNVGNAFASGVSSTTSTVQLSLADLIDKMLKGTLLTTKQIQDASQQMDLFAKLGAVFQSYNAAVNSLNTTAAVAPARLGVFMANMDTLTTTFASFKQRYGYTLMHAAEEVAGSFNAVAGTIVNGVTSLNALSDYKQIPAATIGVFVNDLYVVASNFVAQSKKINTDMLSSMSLISETFGKVAGAVGPAVASLTALQNYTSPAKESFTAFESDMDTLIADFTTMAANFQPEAIAAAAVWGDGVGKIINGVKNGVDPFTQLKDYASPPKQAFQAFEADIYTVVSDFDDMAGKFKIEAVTSAAVWADGVGKLVGGVKSGLDLLVSLKNYSSPAQKGVIAFEKDMYSLVFDLAEGASDFKPEAIAAAAAWGEGIGKLFSGVGNTFQVFDGITKFKGVSQGQAQLLFNQVDMVTGMAERLAAASDMAALDRAADYAAGIDKIYSSFNNVFEFYNNLDHLHSSPVDLITGFLNAFKAVGSFNWQPSASPAISALSSGSSMPQLSAGISMPVPGGAGVQPIIIEGDLVVTLPNAQLPLNQVQANQTAQMISTAIKAQAGKL